MKTVSEVIDALGGTDAMQDRFGLKSKSAVSNWRAANAFPARLHFQIWQACQAAGIDWTPPENEDAA